MKRYYMCNKCYSSASDILAHKDEMAIAFNIPSLDVLQEFMIFSHCHFAYCIEDGVLKNSYYY